MSYVIIDTSVLTDIFLTSRPRHSNAQDLWNHLQQTRVEVRVPMHAAFELYAAVEQEKIKAREEKREISSNFTEDDPLLANYVNIDRKFFDKYFTSELPCMKAGDLIFVAMAKGDNAILITEDGGQYEKAQEFGINVYRIRDYLDEFAKP